MRKKGQRRRGVRIREGGNGRKLAVMPIFDEADGFGPIVSSCGGRPPLLDELERLGTYHGRFRVM